MLKRLFGGVALCLVVVALAGFLPRSVDAQTLQSPNYRFDESTVGSGGLVQSSSPNFQVNSATGDLSIGNSASANYQVEAGSKTTNDPSLAFEIIDSSPNFGSFTATAPSVTTATFSVSNYTSYGYVVQVVGESPSNGDHEIPPIDTGSNPTATPTSGVEQFGINVVANTIPESFGANPDQGQFGFGEAAPNYSVSNEFRYVSGETIALAPKSSGVTIYTISYLVNVANLTPGGQYKTNQTLIVTGTY